MIYVVVTLITLFIVELSKAYMHRFFRINDIYDYRKSCMCALISPIPFILLAAFRYDVGTDYLYTYVPRFNEIAEGKENYFEYGFFMLNKLIQVFTLDYFWLFLTCAVITYSLVFESIYKYLDDPTFGVLMFVISTAFFTSLNTTRQYIAIAIFLYAIRFIQNKQLFRYAAAILIAALFHKSILIMLPVYFICRIKFSIWRSLAVIISGFCLSNILRSILQILFASNRYGDYFNSVYDSETTAVRFLLINLSVLMLGILCRYLSNKKTKDSHLFDKLDIYMQIQVVSTLICACSGVIPLAYRVIWNFSSVQMLLIPEAVSCIKERSIRNFIKICVITAFIGLTVYSIYINGEHDVLPYRTIFSRGREQII